MEQILKIEKIVEIEKTIAFGMIGTLAVLVVVTAILLLMVKGNK